MFQRQFRLPASSRLSHPKIISTPLFLIKYVHNNLAINRYGFIVSKSIDKRAVYRNACKRRLRAVVEVYHIHVKPGNDFLFILKKPIKEASFQDLEKAVVLVIEKYKLKNL